MSYNQTIKLLKQMATEQVSKAEKELNSLASKSIDILQCLFAVLSDQDQEQWLKVVAASFITNGVCQNLFEVGMQVYQTQISQTLLSLSISTQVKRTLQRAIVYLIDSLDEPELIEFRQLTFKLFQVNQLRDSAYLLIGCFCIPQQIDVQHVVYLTRMFIGVGLGTVVGGENGDLTLAKEYNEMVKCWIVAWDRLAKEPGIEQKKGKQEKFKHPEACKVLEQIVNSTQLCSAIIQLYTWVSQSPLYICTHKQLYELNLIKEQVSELHYRALQFCHKKGVQGAIYPFTDQIISNLVNNLAFIAGNANLLGQLECKSFVVNLVKVLRFYFLCEPAKFKQSWKGLLESVIFPLLEPDNEEIEAYSQSPVDFMALFQDCSEKQTFQTLKSQICKLLQKICDKSQVITQDISIINFVIEFAIDSVKNCWGILVPNMYGINYVSFDVCIQTISIFSYRLDSHKKILELAQVFTQNNYASMTDYQRSRVFQFLSYNYAQIYPNPNDGQFWISAALLEKSTQSSIACANDMLFNVADEFYSDYFLQTLKQKISDNQDGIIWSAIEKLVNVQFMKISEALMLQLISSLYNRLDKQFSVISTQATKQTLNAIKMVQILHTISQKHAYLYENTGITPVLWQIVNAYNKAEEYQFEDEIIGIIYELVKMQEVISDNSIQALNWFILQKFAKCEFGNQLHIKLLNCYIMHGKAEIVPLILKALQTGMLFHIMNFGETFKKSQKRVIHANLLLLIQNLLAIHGKCLTQQNIIEISSISMRYLPLMGEKVDCTVVLARALNVLLLCHLYAWTDCTWSYVSNYCKQVYASYDIRVLIACVQMEINKQKNLEAVGQMLVIVGTAIWGFRSRQKANAKAIKVQKKCQTANRLKPIRYKEFEKILKTVQTPFKSQKKLETIFTNLLQKLKQENLQVYTKMISHIGSEETKMICQICGFDSGNLIERKRVHYTMLKPKLPINVVEEDEDMGDSEEEEFKRKRVVNKKKGKAANNIHNAKIEAE